MPEPILSAADYHRLTSYERLRMRPHRLDWANQPRLGKTYPLLERLALAHDSVLPAIAYADLVQLAADRSAHSAEPLDMQTITALLHLTHTVTARSMHGGQPFYFRSVASAGALYPFEMYLAVHRADGIDPGLYHYDPLGFSLNTLRCAPVPVIPPSATGIAATVYISGIYFRSAWKYRDRAYRYVLLDAGHLIENLRLALSALGLASSVELEFDDDATGMLLGLDSAREACLACIHIVDGRPEQDQGKHSAGLAALSEDIRRASRVSEREKCYAPIEQVHRGGYGKTRPSSQCPGRVHGIGQVPVTWQPVPGEAPLPDMDYTAVLWQRRSRRNFISTPVQHEQWIGLLALMAAAAKAPVSPMISPTIGILAGEGLPMDPGFYLFDTRNRRVGLLASGPLIESMATACLDQMWLKNAAAHLLFIGEPAGLDRHWGARGYRHVMMEAGRLGQQAYLAATALGLGACGIGAIYDREAADLLGLSSDGALLYLVGIGPTKTR